MHKSCFRKYFTKESEECKICKDKKKCNSGKEGGFIKGSISNWVKNDILLGLSKKEIVEKYFRQTYNIERIYYYVKRKLNEK